MSYRPHQTPTTPNAPRHLDTENLRSLSRTSSRSSFRNSSSKPSNGQQRDPHEDLSDLDSDLEDMGDRRPNLHRPTNGRSHQPLLQKDDDEERGRTGYEGSPVPAERPHFSRRSTMRSRSPDTQAKLATKKKYTYAAFFLGLSLISFVVQTETAVYIQHELGWNKAYCMLYGCTLNETSPPCSDNGL